MRRPFFLILLCAGCASHAQPPAAKLRQTDHFEITGRSRLVALAKLGAATATTLLVEAGDMSFLAEPITLSADHETVDEVALTILRGNEHYATRHLGALVILSPSQPSKPINRILTLPLGPISFKGTGISSLDPTLGYYIRLATGCNPQGWMWMGPPLDLDIPAFLLDHATFEAILEQVANASEPTMWVVLPDTGKPGCINNPEDHWEVGFYSYGPDGFYTADPAYDRKSDRQVFHQSAGPDLVK